MTNAIIKHSKLESKLIVKIFTNFIKYQKPLGKNLALCKQIVKKNSVNLPKKKKVKAKAKPKIPTFYASGHRTNSGFDEDGRMEDFEYDYEIKHKIPKAILSKLKPTSKIKLLYTEYDDFDNELEKEAFILTKKEYLQYLKYPYSPLYEG